MEDGYADLDAIKSGFHFQMQQRPIGPGFRRMQVARSFVQLSLDERRVFARTHGKQISQAAQGRSAHPLRLGRELLARADDYVYPIDISQGKAKMDMSDVYPRRCRSWNRDQCFKAIGVKP